MLAVTVCVTVLNEAFTIERLLTALSQQTVPPREIIISDGGSSDQTLAVVVACLVQVKKHYHGAQLSSVTGQLPTATGQIPVRCLVLPGNRSLGRNGAMQRARTQWLAITDAGCIPHPDWLAQLIAVWRNTHCQVIAGYYDALARTALEEAMVPYVLVMPDRVDPRSFLPATRSLMIHKTVWRAVGGFDVRLSDNEDYAFANEIVKVSDIAFAREAIVTWLPRQNLSQFYRMLYRFARGDVRAQLIRPKVVLLFMRYLVVLVTLSWLILLQQPLWVIALSLLGLVIYVVWAIAKNGRYTPRGWYWLPVLQFVADAAVIFGSLAGCWHLFRLRFNR